MAMFENFPYTDMHNLNLDWIIKIAKDFLDQYTHIQQLIADGETSLETLTENGLQQLQDKADTLEAALDAWYTQHSGDISDQLASSIADLNAWYALHQNYLDATLTAKTLAFNNAADAKAAETIASIPADYTELAGKVTDLLNYAVLLGIGYTGNLVDPSTVINGEFVNQMNGQFGEYATLSRTDYVPVENGETYCIAIEKNTDAIELRYAWYNSSKTYLSGGTGRLSDSGFMFTAPNGDHPDLKAKYIVISLATSSFPIMFKKSSVRIDYVPYFQNIEITPEKTSFFREPKNLVYPNSCVPGEYVNQTNGQFAQYSTLERTDYVPVTPGKSYYVGIQGNTDSSEFRYAWYNQEKTYLSGGYGRLSDWNFIITAPTNANVILQARFMVVSLPRVVFPIIVEESAEPVSYVPYNSVNNPRLYNSALPEYYVEPEINLPPVMFALVGYQFNLYFDSMIENWKDYKIDAYATKGKQTNRGYTFTPSASDVGNFNLQVSFYDKLGRKYVKTTTVYVCAATSGSGQTKSVIVIGDSTTASGTVIQKLHQNFADDVMSIVTDGTQGTGNNKHEGYDGRSYINLYYTGTDNPFFNPNTQHFDASYYFNNAGIATPDWIIFNLGINDVFNDESDAAALYHAAESIWCANKMIESIQAYSASIKIGIGITIPPAFEQEPFGDAYYCGQYRDRYKRNNILFVNKLIEEFKNKESSGIYLIPLFANLDTVYNMGSHEIAVNSRNNTTITAIPGTGAVHPGTSGYWQLADVYTAFLKYNV